SASSAPAAPTSTTAARTTASPPAACASPARCSTGSATRRRRDSGRFFGIRSPSPGDRFFGFNPSSTGGPSRNLRRRSPLPRPSGRLPSAKKRFRRIPPPAKRGRRKKAPFLRIFAVIDLPSHRVYIAQRRMPHPRALFRATDGVPEPETVQDAEETQGAGLQGPFLEAASPVSRERLPAARAVAGKAPLGLPSGFPLPH